MDARTMHERAVLAALEALVTQHGAAVRSAATTEERLYFSRELHAASKAEFWYRCGVRPEPAGQQRYLVPSSKRDGVVYAVTEGRCTCPAGQHEHVCWHLALTTALELAADHIDQVESAPPLTDADRARAYDDMDMLFAA